MTSDSQSTDFFISYTQADRKWAEWIAWHLEQAGYTTIIQAWDFRTGANFVLAMQEAAKVAERTIAVLSPDYLESDFAAPEWAAAFAQDPKGEKGILLPVRVRKCDLEGLLPQIVYVDLVDLKAEAAKDRLLAGVKEGRAKPTEAPSFPTESERPEAEAPRFPGVLPEIWKVPHPRNRNFTGREALLDRLRETLTAGGTAAVTQAVRGLGGVGKTQLAVEYCYRHSGDYELIWWIHAEESSKMAADYAALAGELGFSEADAADQPAIINAVKEWLVEQHRVAAGL